MSTLARSVPLAGAPVVRVLAVRFRRDGIREGTEHLRLEVTPDWGFGAVVPAPIRIDVTVVDG